MRVLVLLAAALALLALSGASASRIAASPHAHVINNARAHLESVKELVRVHPAVLAAAAADVDEGPGTGGASSGGEGLGGCLVHISNATALNACAQTCAATARGSSAFLANSCTASFVNRSVEIEGLDFSSLFPDLENFFPDLDNITNTTQGNAQFDRFCTCGTTYLRYVFFYMQTVLPCIIGQEIPGLGEAFAQSGQIMDAVGAYMCIKNGPDYCLVTMSQQPDFDEIQDSDETFGNLTEAQKCDFLEDMGCCAPSMVRALRNPALTQAFAEDADADEGGNGGGPGADDEEEFLDAVTEFETALTQCGYGSVRPCLAPGEKDTFAAATVRLNASFAVLSGSAEKLQNFKKGFREDMAAALRVPVPEIAIGSVRNGSVIVDFTVRGADKKAKLDAALATGVPLTNTKAMVAEFSTLEDVSASNTATSASVVENDSDVSPAAAGAVPSLVALVLVAALALFQ